MIFDSLDKTVLIIVIIIIFNLQKKIFPEINIKNVFLLLANIIILSLLISFTSIFNIFTTSLMCYLVGLYLKKTNSDNNKRSSQQRLALLSSSIVLLTLFFILIKYDWAKLWLGQSKFDDLAKGLNLIQLLGLSYIFFKLIHFLVDSYRNQLPPLDPVTFINYIFFFPTFLSGPIDRYQNFSRWMNGQSSKKSNLFHWAALYRIFSGLIKKFLLVPLVATYALDFNQINSNSGFKVFLIQLLVSLFAYSFYLYFDFSGYSDLAIGVSLFLGFRVPENFRTPYLAKDISDFWKRWHISLSSILKEYIYMPVIRFINNRFRKNNATMVTITGYLITFIICGIWHGSTFNYVLWGLWHGVGLSVLLIWKKSNFSKRVQQVKSKLFKTGLTIVSIIITFTFVSFGWLFFNYQMYQIFHNKVTSTTLFHKVFHQNQKFSAQPYYFEGYGWGIILNYTIPPIKSGGITVGVDYRKQNDQDWIPFIRNRTSEFSFADIYGTETFNNTNRNLAPGIYDVRLDFFNNGNIFFRENFTVEIPNYKY